MDASAGELFRSTPGEAAAGVSAQSKDAGRRAALAEPPCPGDALHPNAHVLGPLLKLMQGGGTDAADKDTDGKKLAGTLPAPHGLKRTLTTTTAASSKAPKHAETQTPSCSQAAPAL